jgi:hypothetical protein
LSVLDVAGADRCLAGIAIAGRTCRYDTSCAANCGLTAIAVTDCLIGDGRVVALVRAAETYLGVHYVGGTHGRLGGIAISGHTTEEKM